MPITIYCHACKGTGSAERVGDAIAAMNLPRKPPCLVCGGYGEAFTDAALLAAYQRTTGEPGDPEADALLAEIERRGLDV